MRQKWGQNYLSDDRVSRRIVEALGAGSDDAVLEIGPGKGALTRFLVGKTARLILVELDRELTAGLKFRWEDVPGVHIIQSDFLKWPFPSDLQEGVRVVGNLPYSASAAILNRLLDWTAWREGVFMVQKEVAARILARPGSGDYGILSLAVQSRAEGEILFDVGPGAFSPAPKVVSTVFRLRRFPSPRVADEAAFFRVVKAAFGQRRKTVLNSLSHGLDKEKKVVEAALTACGLEPSDRAERISLEQFVRLSEELR